MTEFFRDSCSGMLKGFRLIAQQVPSSIQQQQRRKLCQQLKSAVSDFRRSNALGTSVPELMELARALHMKQEYHLALTVCQTCFDLLAAPQGTTASLGVLTAQTKISAAKSEAALLATEDPELVLADSVLRLVNALGSLQAAMQSMLPDEQNRWLVYEGAIAIKQICTGFRSLPGRYMMQFLAFTMLAMDTDLTFSLPEHLPLRIDVYLALAQCQQTAGFQAETVATVQKGLAAVASIEMLEKLDPLPPSSEAQAAYAHAKTRLNIAQFGYTATTLPSEQAVKDALQAMFTSDSDKIAAVAGSLLPIAPNRVVKHQSCPAAMAKLMALAEAMVKPHLVQLSMRDGKPDQASPQMQAAITAVTMDSHQSLLCAAYHLRSADLFQQLVDAGRARVSSDGDLSNSQSLAALIELLHALHLHQQSSDGAVALPILAEKVEQHAAAVFHILPDIATDAALALWEAARPLLEGAVGAQDAGADQAAKVLMHLHGALQSVALGDPLLRVSLGLRLALHLQAAADPAAAATVLKKVIPAAEVFRIAHLQARRGRPDEQLIWISGSRSQPNGGAQTVMSGMGPQEAALAGLHADALALLTRIELELGQANQQALAQRHQSSLGASLDKRHAQSAIWGKTTAAQQRLEQTRLQKAGTVASHPLQTERQLEELANRNLYQLALLRMHQACYQLQPHKQSALLQEAAQLLQQAQAAEDTLFKAAEATSVQRSQTPQAPVLLMRSPTSMTLTHRAFHLKTHKKPAFFAVYAKAFGAGVALGMNSTSMELEGTGVQQPLGTRVTISGLQPNETYTFAVAAYDPEHNLISELGQSAGPVAALLPLPLLHVWSQLALTAAQLGVLKLTHLAAGIVLPHFIITQPDCPVWEANPLDRQTVNRAHLEAASPALLRLVCQVVFVTCHDKAEELSKQQPDAAMRKSCVPQQLGRFHICKRLLIAMQVAAYIGDGMLLNESANRFHNCVAPLLAAKAPHGLLKKALTACHVTLTEAKTAYAASFQGASESQEVAGRVSATVAYHLLNACADNKQAEAAAWLAKQDSPLLQHAPLQPGATIKVTVEQQALEDYLLTDPAMKAAASQLLSIRLASADTVTQVLSQLGSKAPQELWNLIHMDSAPAGKGAAKAPAAKGPATTKGKPGTQAVEPVTESFLQHPRYVETCVRVMEAAVQQGMASSLPTWCLTVQHNIRANCKMPRVDFDRWKLEDAAAQVTPPVGSEPAAAAQGQSTEAAVRFLQQRVRQLMPRRKQVMKQRAALTASWPWLARLQCILAIHRFEGCQALLQTGLPDAEASTPSSEMQIRLQEVLGGFACAVECCQRGASWLQLLQVTRLWWTCARPIFNQVPILTQPTAKATWRVDTPPPAEPAQPASKAAAAKAGVPKPQNSKGTTSNDAGPLPSDALDEDAPRGPVRWKYVGGSANAARFSNVTIKGLVHLLACMRQGLQVHAGVVPAPSSKSDKAKGAAHDADSSSGLSLGSDALALPWYTQQTSLDMHMCCNLVCMALAVLHRMKRHHTVVQVGRAFQEVSEGQFTERIAPYLMQAAPFAGVDRLPFQQALQNAVRDKRKAVESLEGVRLLVTDNIGSTSLLAERLGKRMAKHKSRASSPSLSRRQASSSQRGSVMGDRLQSEVGSVVSHTTANTTASRSSQPIEARLPTEYMKVIDQLGAAKEKTLQVEATNELGDIYAHFGSWKEAVQAWNDALDCIIGPYQVIRCWRQHLSGKTATELLQQYGIPGLLMSGGVILGKLVQHGSPSDLHTQLEGACMTAQLMGACFSCSLVHPQRAVDFATYTPLELWEGTHLFHDPHKCNPADMLSGLPCIIAVLLENGYSLQALPAIALLEWLAQHVCGSLPATVAVRLQRVQALTQLGLLAQAATVLGLLLLGQALPDMAGPTACHIHSADGSLLKTQLVPPFNNAELPGHTSNKACLDFLCTAEASAPVAALYGPALTGKLTIATANWLRAVGEVPDQWKQTTPYTAAPAVPAAASDKGAKPKPSTAATSSAIEGVCLGRAAAMLQALVDKLRNPAGLTAAKGNGRPASSKPAGKTPGKASGQPEELPVMDVLLPADLIIAARLSLSEVLLAQWLPAKALEQVLAAVKAFQQASQPAQAAAPQADKPQASHNELPSQLWLQCRLQAMRVLKEMQQRKAFTTLLAVSLAEASKVNDKARADQLQSLDLSMHIAAGTLPQACALAQQLLEKPCLPRSGLAELCLTAGDLKDSLGMRSDAHKLWQQALTLAQQDCQALGLRERQVHTELRNLYMVGNDTLIQALMRQAVRLLRQQQAAAAVEASRQAFEMVQQVRCLPLLQAQAAALLGRCCIVHSHTASQPAAIDEARAAAKASLRKAITWCTTDAAGPSLGLLRSALLDMASGLLAERAVPDAFACLQGAATAGACLSTLLTAPQDLCVVTAPAVPAWASTMLQGEELAFNRDKALPEPGATLDPGLLSRLLLCHYASLVSALDKSPGDFTLSMQHLPPAAQALQLHAVLRDNCAQYKASCCMPEGLLVLDNAPAPPSGMLALQWHLQDGSWQDPSSWHAHGTLTKAEPSYMDLLSLVKPCRAASLLFVVNAPIGMLAGEAVFDVAQLSALDMRIKSTVLQVTESQQALADADLEVLKSAVSSFFSKQQGPDSSRPITARQVQELSAGQAAAPSSREDKAADKAATPVKKGKGIIEPGVPVLQTVPGQIAELSRWSNMLQPNNGLILQDNDMADWLASLLKVHC